MHGPEQTISESYLALGRYDLARQRCESPATVIADDDRHWCLALAFHALGMPAEASGELHKLKALGWGEALPFRTPTCIPNGVTSAPPWTGSQPPSARALPRSRLST
jgi:hypothetical protein